MNLNALLAPITPDSPCGDDLSFSLEFDTILEKRREDDPSLDQGEWVKALKVADWPGVVSQCDALMRTRTKDLRVVGWLTDALCRTRGFAGLADGLTLCARLCEDQWVHLHPLPDGGDQEQRSGSLNWLLGQVVELARLAPVIDTGIKRYGLREIDAARTLQQAIGRGVAEALAAAAGGALTLDEVARAQAATPRALMASNLNHLGSASEALSRIQLAVDTSLGDDGPSFSAARKALDDARNSIERFARDAGPGAAAASRDVVVSSERSGERVARGANANANADADAASGPLQTRAQALQQLRAVAEFFRRTEPHSPVAYLADKAAQWGDMPLHAWLRVVLKDPSALAHVEELLGVEPPPASN